MKKGILITSSIIVLLVAVIMSPYFCGNAIENKFNEKVTEFQHALKVDSRSSFETIKYTKGWFSSSAQTQLTINGQSFVMDHKIIHGPWQYFGLGKIETTFEFNDKVKPALDKLFAGKSPLIITTKIGFSGFDSITVFSPTIAKQPLPAVFHSTISWGGMMGNINFVGDRLKLDINIPEMSIEDNYDHFSINNINLTGDAIYLYNNLPTAAGKNWTGKTVLNIDKLAVTNGGESYSSAINLVVNTKDEEKGVINYDTTLKFTNIKLPSQLGLITNEKDVLEFGAALTGIPKQPLAELIAYVENIQRSGRTPNQMEMVLAGQNLATSILQGTPSIMVRSLINGVKGKVAIIAEAKLATPDASKRLDKLVFSAQNRLIITVLPSFSAGLLDEAIIGGQLPMSKDEIVKSITEKNRFILNNGEYSGKFEYRQGHLYSNGQQDDDLQKLLRQIIPRNLLRF